MSIMPSKVNKAIFNMEKLQQMIDEETPGYVGESLITESFSNGLPIAQSPDIMSNNKFTIGIDMWGTSTRRVGP